MEELLEEILAEDGAALTRLAWGLTGSADQARDLVQDSLVRVASQWRKVASADNRSAYVRAVLLNVWRDQRRRKTVATSPLEHDPTSKTEPAEDRLVDRHVLIKAMTSLSPQQRNVVILRFLDDQSVHSTAYILGCSDDTVRTQSHRALRILREHPQLHRYIPNLEVPE
ncbi:sigma-70 family RNA polymerase sigma factor [Aestuariimicrobium sp. T2.26MG-19.2B]|uniref:sigma-70 family RNA polymerase sigma factor n=1 Tax=Aestuariimicrobium sp. T2.26MG-19.2B TaxID=3040679 RepID=UPI00247745DE|nr:sigma-70 family RNA polymerase sigma factor [Aestuariimicrobium sp. T2.26MG-19.2B]CAI9411772.1 RNA polymerase sigma-E factor [Aestuariimicrobium sp. T2.26MG-19.2B]